jgi:hypothetical protein
VVWSIVGIASQVTEVFREHESSVEFALYRSVSSATCRIAWARAVVLLSAAPPNKLMAVVRRIRQNITRVLIEPVDKLLRGHVV